MVWCLICSYQATELETGVGEDLPRLYLVCLLERVLKRVIIKLNNYNTLWEITQILPRTLLLQSRLVETM